MSIGRHRRKESINKGISTRRKNGWWRNPEETRKKQRIARLGTHPSEETKKRMSIAKTNPSKETRKKLSMSLTGRHLTKEHKNNIRIANTNPSPERRQRMCKSSAMNNPKIHKKADETKKQKFASGEYDYLRELRSKTMTKTRKTLVIPVKNTSIEVKIQKFLKKLRIEFFTHQYMKIEHGYQCDILIPSMNMVIECDGDYWHKYPIGRDNDKIRTKELIKKGFKVLRLWECEIIPMTIKEFRERIGENTK